MNFGASIFGAVLVSVVALWVAGQLGSIIGNALRLREIRAAADAGLREDCMQLLHNWPVKDDRIGDWDAAFTRLPHSITMLSPAYVINERVDDSSVPPNIGICKNGFGGFAFGVRVFRNDQDADKFINDMKRTMRIGRDFGYQRVASGIYYWWEDT
jgi:hypothetical protein